MKQKPRFHTAIESASMATGVSAIDIMGHCRLMEIVRARHIAMAVGFDMIDNKSRVGRLFQPRRDHSAVIHALNRIHTERRVDRQLNIEYRYARALTMQVPYEDILHVAGLHVGRNEVDGMIRDSVESLSYLRDGEVLLLELAETLTAKGVTDGLVISIVSKTSRWEQPETESSLQSSSSPS